MMRSTIRNNSTIFLSAIGASLLSFLVINKGGNQLLSNHSNDDENDATLSSSTPSVDKSSAKALSLPHERSILRDHVRFGWSSRMNKTCCSSTSISENEEGQQPPISTFSPFPPLHIVRPNENLEICFDKRTRNPVYVQHRICIRNGANNSTSNNKNNRNKDNDGQHDVEDTDDSDDSMSVDGDSNDGDDTASNQGQSKQKKRRRYHFKEDISLPEYYRSRNQHYHLSGYDRGHLAPAADFETDTEDTYNLCNVSPQNHEMNRKIWSYLEYWVRKITQQEYHGDDANTSTMTAYVTTGPLWLPKTQASDKQFIYNYSGIGRAPSLVQVPTHFFKVVVIVATHGNDAKQSEIRKFACFVVPNESSASAPGKSIGDYIVPWTDLEVVSGLTFYPNIADDAFKATADALTQLVTRSNRRTQLGQGRQHQTLLLSDGSVTATKNTAATSSNAKQRSSFFQLQKWNKNSSSIVHLCDNDDLCFRQLRTKQNKNLNA